MASATGGSILVGDDVGFTGHVGVKGNGDDVDFDARFRACWGGRKVIGRATGGLARDGVEEIIGGEPMAAVGRDDDDGFIFFFVVREELVLLEKEVEVDVGLITGGEGRSGTWI